MIEIADSDGVTQLIIDPFPGLFVDSQSNPVLVDLDNDGDLEIVRGYDNGVVVAYHHTGAEILPADGKRLELQGTIKSTPAVGGIDFDLGAELVFQTGDNLLYVVDGALNIAAGFPVDLGGAKDSGAHYFLTPSPVLANVAGDKLPEIIVVNIDGDVSVLDASGVVQPGWPVALGVQVMASPAVGDIDNDGSADIVIAASDQRVFALSLSGVIKDGWPAYRGQGGTSSPSLIDADGDGSLEILVGSFDGKLHGFEADGSSMAGLPIATRSLIHASPFFADLNGDGVVEALCGSDDGGLYAFDLAGGGATRLLQTGSLVVTAGSVGDIDNDGQLEIAVGSHDGVLHIVQTDSTAGIGSSVTWNGFRGTPGNSGNGGRAITATSGTID